MIYKVVFKDIETFTQFVLKHKDIFYTKEFAELNNFDEGFTIILNSESEWFKSVSSDINLQSCNKVEVI
jgi:hypothetical protein